MASAEHLAYVLSMQTRGVQVLLWEHKADLIRALLVLRAATRDFPDEPVVMPTEQPDLQRFSIRLFEESEQSPIGPRRILLIPQGSTGTIGTWLNGWRRRLADPPGTILVVRRAEFVALYQRAPDLMSFAQSEVHDATGLLPLVEPGTLARISGRLPDGWYGPLDALPGGTPSSDAIGGWVQRLKAGW
jgi:hypothetical protein